MPKAPEPAPTTSVVLAIESDLRRRFPGIRDETLDRLNQATRLVTFKSGDFLLHQGAALQMWTVLSGFVAERSTTPEGRRFTHVILRANHVIGALSAWRPLESNVDLVALTDGHAAVISGSALRRIAQSDGHLALHLFDLTAATARLVEERLDQVTTEDARTSFATAMLTYEPLVAGADPIVTRAELAGLMGTSRQMLGAVVRAFESEGVVRREGRRIIIVDRAALERAANWQDAGMTHADWLTFVLRLRSAPRIRQRGRSIRPSLRRLRESMTQTEASPTAEN